MLPARDVAEDDLFPAEDVAWIKKWQDDFTADHAALLHNTINIATLDRGVGNGGGKPRLGYLDGTASFADDDSEGVIFLFNPAPRPTSGWLRLDESLGIANASSADTWLAHEIYPREEEDGVQTPVGLWGHGSSVEIYVPPTTALVLRLRKQTNARPTTNAAASKSNPSSLVAVGDSILPLILNLTYTSATAHVQTTGNAGKYRVSVNITGAVGLVGDAAKFEVITAVPDPKSYQLHSVYVNGKLAYVLPGYEWHCIDDSSILFYLRGG